MHLCDEHSQARHACSTGLAIPITTPYQPGMMKEEKQSIFKTLPDQTHLQHWLGRQRLLDVRSGATSFGRPIWGLSAAPFTGVVAHDGGDGGRCTARPASS
eukprot:1160671-Pelagomonas_calceolata.AAC.4